MSPNGLNQIKCKEALKVDNKTIDKQIERIDCILESCQSPELRAHYMQERTSLGEKKIENCNEMLNKVMNQEASGLITEDVAEDLIDKIETAKTEAYYEAYPWFEDAANAAGYKLALNEVAALASATVALIPSGVIGKALTAPIRKFIMGRLSKYTMIHTNTVDFKELDSQNYDLIEAEKKGIKFQHAAKWLDKGISRVHVVVYTYKGKEVMGIAFSKDMSAGISGNSALVEPVIMDGSFKKDQDYYVACMCTQQQFTHPCIKRVLKTMKKDWSEKVDTLKSDIQESVEESIANGTHGERLALILECAKDGRIDPKSAKLYTEEMRASEIHMYNVEAMI